MGEEILSQVQDPYAPALSNSAHGHRQPSAHGHRRPSDHSHNHPSAHGHNRPSTHGHPRPPPAFRTKDQPWLPASSLSLGVIWKQYQCQHILHLAHGENLSHEVPEGEQGGDSDSFGTRTGILGPNLTGSLLCLVSTGGRRGSDTPGMQLGHPNSHPRRSLA